MREVVKVWKVCMEWMYGSERGVRGVMKDLWWRRSKRRGSMEDIFSMFRGLGFGIGVEGGTIKPSIERSVRSFGRLGSRDLEGKEKLGR